HIAPAVRDPMDMNVNAYPVLPEGDAEDQVGALVTDAVEAHQHLARRRDRSAELLDDPARDFVDLPGLRGVKGARVDQPVDLGRREAKQSLGRPRDRKEG